MKNPLRFVSLFGLATIAVGLGSAHGQTAPEIANAEDDAQETVELPSFVVTGTRQSLITAQETKRDHLAVVDAIAAEDITKLPDVSVSDALQRITGIQIARDRGEGSVVAVRGLTQVEATLNGREIFTASSGRALDFADFPAEMVSAINVYKSSSADRLEGGVGGQIDLRTRRPFDFEGSELVGSVRFTNGNLVDQTKPQFSALASNRWKLKGGGEFGALASVVWQERAWREDQKSSGAPVTRTDLIPGQSVVAPNGTSETTSFGERNRLAGSAVLQWRPGPQWEFYAEGGFTEFKTEQNSHQINVSPSATSVPGSTTLFPGTNDVKTVSYTDAPFSVLSFTRDTVDRTKLGAIGAIWTGDDLTIKADASYTTSFNNLYFVGPFFAGTAGTFTQDLSTTLPGTTITGTDLTDPSNFRYTGIAYRVRPFDGDLTAFSLDADYERPDGLFDQVSAGVRYARRGAGNAPGLLFADTAVSDLTAADTPGFVRTSPFTDFFPGRSESSITGYFIGKLDLARDPVAERAAFGITEPLPTAAPPLWLWDIDEETSTAYLMGKFHALGQGLEGNLGVRLIRTHEAVTGSQSVPSTGEIAPIAIDSTYTDALPSLNLRYQISDGLYLRSALSKTLTRPDFNQLSPSLTLLPNPINPELNQGAAGNPELKPIRADNVDVAVEKYFNAVTSVHLTGFYKQVDGFIANASQPEIHDGATYQVSRPYNSSQADIKGFEVGYQQFFDLLPSPFAGLGVQANYTYIDSSTPSSILGQDTPLQNLSKHSYNLIGMYERGKLSWRVAYNWRDTFFSGTTNIVGIGTIPIYTEAYGWLDASLAWRASDRMTFRLEGSNLLRTMRRSYYGVTTRQQSNWLNDRQINAAVTIRF